jgi:acyl-CoA reductase-like NAD-dependent aldehyde dehydrogenase
MAPTIKIVSPIDGSILAERALASEAEIASALNKASLAQAKWRAVPIQERVQICRRFADEVLLRKDELGHEITCQMGRPVRYTPGEIQGMVGRANAMADIAEAALSSVEIEKGLRFIRRVPLGVVFAIAPWNYPYLTAVNTVVPALLAGNAVILKHSPQTLLCAERMVEGFLAAGLPEGVFQFLHLSDENAEGLVRSDEVDFVAFTGSVRVGRIVQKAASDRFIGVGLELGGKDPAYVRADANLDFTVEQVVEGAFFNSGQSCCAIERIYVHRTLFDDFVTRAVAETRAYVLGNPLDQETTLGPLVSVAAADHVRRQVAEAVAHGALPLIDEAEFPNSRPGTAYLAPQILTGVNHSMSLMRDESFGPVVGIMAVDSDEDAIAKMNDSNYGLTASIWTNDRDAAITIGDQLETGTCFMNRCDYLDPALAWTGVKDSGRGCTLSRIGFEQLTRPKSFHLRP